MKSSLIWMSLLALASVGVANADTNTAPAQRDTVRYDVSCNFAKPGFECGAWSRILLSRDQAQTESAQPAWFGNLLSVACRPVTAPPEPPFSLISASDATLYTVTGDPFTRWQIQNSDSTVSVNLPDHPFTDHPVVGIAARLDISGHGHIDGHCDVIPHH